MNSIKQSRCYEVNVEKNEKASMQPLGVELRTPLA